MYLLAVPLSYYYLLVSTSMLLYRLRANPNPSYYDLDHADVSYLIKYISMHIYQYINTWNLIQYDDNIDDDDTKYYFKSHINSKQNKQL